MGNILILNYHDIIDGELGEVDNSKVKDKFTISTKSLIKQLDLILANNIPIVGLNTRDNGNSTFQFGIALTFSGGHKSAVETVLPLLKSRGACASFFPTLSAVNAPDRLSWCDLNQLIDSGMDLGSQGISGQNLRRFSKKACQLELELSKRIFEKNTGKKINTFAPALGSYNRRLLQLAYNAGYEKVIGNRTKINTNSNALLMHSVTVKSTTTHATLEKLIVKGLLSNSKTPFLAALSSQLTAEFGIGLLHKKVIKKEFH